tara:strand:- start:4959 stop:5381 length:423 start_codon:yes stop_codon:yes gene_type:complete
MKKNKSPFDIMKSVGEKQDIFKMPKDKKMNNPMGSMGSNKAPGFQPDPSGPGVGDLYTGPGNDEMDTDPGQYDNDTDYGSESCYNLLGQQVSCGNCPDGSLVNMGQCMGGSGDGDNDGGGTDDGCSPQYNMLGQCISCCD